MQQGIGGLKKSAQRVLGNWWIIAAIIAVLCTLFFFWGIDSYPMQNWDEGVHSQVTREMVETQDYWTLQYQGDQYFRKPPVKMWLTAPLVSVFGDHNWVYRFWSALAGVLATVLLARFVYEKEKRPLVVWLTSLIFLSGQYIFYHSFRTGEMDGLLILFWIAGFYSYWRGQTKPKWFLLMGVSFGLAVMTKSLAGFIAPIVVLLDIMLTRQWKLFVNKYLWWGVGAFLVVSVPWHLSQVILWGRDFWDVYIGFHIVDRTFTQLYTDLPTWWYAKIIYGRLFPLSLFLIGGTLVIARDVFKDRKHDLIVLILWVLVPFLMYTLIKTKFEWYILPVYPALAWIIARFGYAMIRRFKDWLVASTTVLSVFLMFAMVDRAVTPGAKTYWFILQAYIPRSAVDALGSAYVLSGIAVAFLLLVLFFMRKKYPYSVQIAFCLVLVYALGFAFGRNLGTVVTLPTQSVYQEILADVGSAKPEAILLYDTDLYGRPAGYFELASLGLPIENVDTEAAVEKAISKGSTVIITESELGENTGYNFIAQHERYRIYANK